MNRTLFGEAKEMIEVKTANKCKGATFRGYSSTFYDSINSRVERKEGIKLLKSKSCHGCQFCGFIFDQLPDMIDSESLIFPDEGIVTGKLYSIRVINESRDYESGMMDDWDFEIFEIKGKEE